LDALYTGPLTRTVNWVLDLDIRGFFDAIDHGWLVPLVEHRIAGRRVVRLVQKWLNAGVLEDGQWTRMAEGTLQEGSALPLQANIYLHYAFDLWVQAWRQRHAHGDIIVVRFADDIVIGFQSEWDARQFRGELTARFRKFHLELHPEKTRLIEFGPFAGREPPAERGQQTGDVRLPRLHAHLCDKAEQRALHGAAADRPQATAGQAERGHGRASATPAQLQWTPNLGPAA
jgi:hypothetical protein